MRLYERLGLRREGVLRDTLFVRGQWYSDVRMSMLEAEFHERGT